MQSKNFSLRECYTLACYGLRAVISNGQLEEFTREDDDGVQANDKKEMCLVREDI